MVLAAFGYLFKMLKICNNNRRAKLFKVVKRQVSVDIIHTDPLNPLTHSELVSSVELMYILNTLNTPYLQNSYTSMQQHKSVSFIRASGDAIDPTSKKKND